MKIVLRASFDVFSRDGADAIDLAGALSRAGADVTPYPTAIRPGLPRSFTMLLEKDPSGPKDVLLQFGPLESLDVPDEWVAIPRVAYTRWHGDVELPDLSDWDGLVAGWPSNAEELMRTHKSMKVGIVPFGINDQQVPRTERPGTGPVRFLSVVDTALNATTVLAAWTMADTKDASLTVHIAHPGKGADEIVQALTAEHDYKNLTVTLGGLTRENVDRMYAAHHVLIVTSPDAGRVAMEFMASGGVLIAPYIDEYQNLLFSGCTMEGGSAKVIAMRVTDQAERPDVLRRTGQTAADTIRSAMSWDVLAPRMVEYLRRVR